MSHWRTQMVKLHKHNRAVGILILTAPFFSFFREWGEVDWGSGETIPDGDSSSPHHALSSQFSTMSLPHSHPGPLLLPPPSSLLLSVSLSQSPPAITSMVLIKEGSCLSGKKVHWPHVLHFFFLLAFTSPSEQVPSFQNLGSAPDLSCENLSTLGRSFVYCFEVRNDFQGN